jgi:hypothetical protein
MHQVIQLLVAVLILVPLAASAQTEPIANHFVPCADPAPAFAAEWHTVDGAVGPLGCAVSSAVSSQGDWAVQELLRTTPTYWE